MFGNHFRLIAAALVANSIAVLPQETSAGCISLRQIAAKAVSEDPEIAKAAITNLRSAGEPGLNALLVRYQLDIEKYASAKKPASIDAAWQRIKAAIDAVGGQRDCHASRLYWYTDFEAAKAAAKHTHKPILSLRLLGNLTDECSFANSRFFRSTLYANAEVSKVLREQFVLHWQSVRPVPKVTIDFGDGRKLERTVTGNSIHYILDSEGSMIDALPGLYGPQAFLREITEAGSIAKVANDHALPRDEFLRKYHRERSGAILAAWQSDLRQLGLLAIPEPPQALAEARAARPKAVRANDLALPKMRTQDAIVAGVLVDARALSTATDAAVWGRIAQLHLADAELDAASRAFISAQNPSAAAASALAVGKAEVETPLLHMIRTLQNSIAIDSVRNEFTLHRQIHDWLASGEVPLDVDLNQLNDRVYAELFLTPRTDPWLGLLPEGVYTALDNNGLVQ